MARISWRKILGKAPSVGVRRGRGRRLRGLEWLEPRRVLSADLAAAFDWPDPPLATAVQAADAAAFVLTDASGQQAAVDPFQAAPLAELQQSYLADEDAVWQDYELSNTFSLHSNPDADHTIYLDFDGHQTSGTSWNTAFGGGAGLVTPAWSSDSDRQSFSSAERAMIQRIWAGVSEDFAPFDVDVTTEPPPADDLQRSGASDDRWGVRVVIGPNTWFQPAGGVAYIGSFNWNSDTPCFVFNVGEAAIREAASHEVGHTLGLHHDGDTTTEYYRGHGTGSTRWAPIMGSSYAASQSHWSRGDYAGANNHEDDLEIIATQNGFGYRQDDHGDSPNESSPLATSGNSLLESTYGRIEKGDDRDVFSFWSDAGPISLQVDPLPFAANLDVGAVLYDANGKTITSSAPANKTSVMLTPTLTEPGQYFLHVMGTGNGNPAVDGYTAYGSLGHYRIQGQIVPLVPGTPDPVLPDEPAIASAGLSNGGFEQGTTGWEASGHATTETASFGEAPHQGAKQALITNRNQAAGNVPVSELESFLKLSRGRISAISSGTPTAGSAIRQTIQVQAGDVVTFRFSFLTNESTPAGAYNDLACFSYSGASENAVVLLSDTHASGFADSPTTLKASTGYRTYQHTFTTGGQVTIGFAVIDAKDTGYDSALLLDGVEVARGTNQHSAPVTSGSESVLTNGNFASGLSGWNSTGHATADLAGLKETPPVQSGQAWVSTSDSDGGSVAVGELESFLGVSSGSLNGLNDARATAGSAIRQTITAQAGTTLRVRYRFLTNEKTPATGFKDFAFLTLAGSQASEAILLADTTSGGFATSGSIYRESTGYRTVEVVLSETGPVTIGFGVSDAKDTSFDSALLIDQIELVDGA